MDKNLDPAAAVTEEAPKKASLINPKVFLIGLPVFIVQLVVVYFVTANILLSKIETTKESAGKKTEAHNSDGGEQKKDTTTKPAEFGKYIYNFNEDLICNVAETNNKLLLTSIGFDLGSEEQVQKVKSKEILVKDIVISVLSSKNLAQLSNVTYRDTIKMEISKNIIAAVPKTKINNIYFSKYIIQ